MTKIPKPSTTLINKTTPDRLIDMCHSVADTKSDQNPQLLMLSRIVQCLLAERGDDGIVDESIRRLGNQLDARISAAHDILLEACDHATTVLPLPSEPTIKVLLMAYPVIVNFAETLPRQVNYQLPSLLEINHRIQTSDALHGNTKCFVMPRLWEMTESQFNHSLVSYEDRFQFLTQLLKDKNVLPEQGIFEPDNGKSRIYLVPVAVLPDPSKPPIKKSTVSGDPVVKETEQMLMQKLANHFAQYELHSDILVGPIMVMSAALEFAHDTLYQHWLTHEVNRGVIQSKGGHHGDLFIDLRPYANDPLKLMINGGMHCPEIIMADSQSDAVLFATRVGIIISSHPAIDTITVKLRMIHKEIEMEADTPFRDEKWLVRLMCANGALQS